MVATRVLLISLYGVMMTATGYSARRAFGLIITGNWHLGGSGHWASPVKVGSPLPFEPIRNTYDKLLRYLIVES